MACLPGDNLSTLPKNYVYFSKIDLPDCSVSTSGGTEAIELWPVNKCLPGPNNDGSNSIEVLTDRIRMNY